MSEDQRPFVNHYLQHEGFVSGVFDSHDLPSEVSSEDKSYFYNFSNNSTSLLLPTEDMAPFNIGKSKEGKFNKAKPKRTDTPPARVFEDLPSAYTSIVRQPSTPIQVMQNMTGTSGNLPHLIQLPTTPPRPGPASPELQRRLAEAKAASQRRRLLSTPERPITSLLPESPALRLRGPRQARITNDNLPASDFVPHADQIRRRRHAMSHENMPTEGSLVRNSRSFFDLDDEAIMHDDQYIRRLESYAEGVFAASRTLHRVIEGYPSAGPPHITNNLIPQYRDIRDVVIPGAENPTPLSEARGEVQMPAPLRLNRRQVSTGRAPAAGLPRLPTGVPRYQYQQNEFASSEVTEYNNTHSILNVARFDPDPIIGEGWPKQNEETGQDSGDDFSQDVDEGLCGTTADDFGHELSRCGPRQPQGHSSGLSQSSDISDEIGMSATAPYHAALKVIYNEGNPDETGLRYRERTVPESGQSVDRGWTSSHLSEDVDLAQLAAGESDPHQDQDCDAVGKLSDQQDVFERDAASAKWFANVNKKESRKKEAEPADNCDWETVRGSAVDSEQLSPAAPQPLQPPFEPVLRTTFSRTGPHSDSSLADFTSSGFDSVSANQGKLATPWDPIQEEATRVHPALSGTPHKYRLRKDTVTGEQIYVPEYSLPGFGELSSSGNDSADSAQAAPDLPTGYLIPVSKFSASTPRQQVEDNSSDKEHPSSPSIIPRRQHETRMRSSSEAQDRPRGRSVHEPEGYHRFGIGIAISTNEVPGKYTVFAYLLYSLT